MASAHVITSVLATVLLIAGLRQPASAEGVIGSVPEEIDVKVADGSVIHLHSVMLARYSTDLNRWVGEFTAKRERVPKVEAPLDTVDLSVAVRLRSGKEITFAAPHANYTVDYWVDTDALYNPEEIASYDIHVSRTSWIERGEQQAEYAALARREARDQAATEARERKRRAAQDARDREERARLAAQRSSLVSECKQIYERTSDKKIADLTVKEERAVRACEALDMYPPE